MTDVNESGEDESSDEDQKDYGVSIVNHIYMAISRRASLHEKIRDYERAFLDLKRPVSLLEKHSEKKYVKDLKVSRQHLSSLKKYMKKAL
ncbi:DnaJ domain-containing protein [Artemisia annua]|uniref:DnaJ domain-containing protein n=1 Tax=Artemisia annua TaxID=35608 RepID=A0A2U1PF10_ARTAN|nr:DnaJ domain-containing protein [Artemisia annua]